MQQCPSTVIHVPRPPPVYAVVRKNRAGGFGVQSETSAPVADTAAGDKSTYAASPADSDTAQHSAPPARSSLYQDLTLIDNDLYA